MYRHAISNKNSLLRNKKTASSLLSNSNTTQGLLKNYSSTLAVASVSKDELLCRVHSMVRAYRNYGHLEADIDPLGLNVPKKYVESSSSSSGE